MVSRTGDESDHYDDESEVSVSNGRLFGAAIVLDRAYVLRETSDHTRRTLPTRPYSVNMDEQNDWSYGPGAVLAPFLLHWRHARTPHEIQLVKRPVGSVVPVPRSDSLRMILPGPIKGDDAFQIPQDPASSIR